MSMYSIHEPANDRSGADLRLLQCHFLGRVRSVDCLRDSTKVVAFPGEVGLFLS